MEANNPYTTAERQAIGRAFNIIKSRWFVSEGESLSSPRSSRDLLRLHLADGMQREHFAVVFLDSQHGLIAVENLFMGTLDGAAVYPREVAKRALELNAAAIVLGHNHPSGNSHPSPADRRITTRLTEAMGLLDIRVLDHVIVAADEYYSFAEEGLM